MSVMKQLRKWQENGLAGGDSSLTGQEWDDSKAAKEAENAIGAKKGNSNWSLASYFGGSH